EEHHCVAGGGHSIFPAQFDDALCLEGDENKGRSPVSLQDETNPELAESAFAVVEDESTPLERSLDQMRAANCHVTTPQWVSARKEKSAVKHVWPITNSSPSGQSRCPK